VRLYGPNGQPISQQTPLDVRDQQLRDFLGSVHDEESDALKVALTGSRVEQTVIAREVRQAGLTSRTAATPPPGTIGALIEHRIWGMTGTFAQDQGARLEIGLMKTYDVATSGPWHFRRTGWARFPSATFQQVILLYPGVTLSDADNEAAQKVGSLYLPVRPLTPIRLAIEIAGTFNAGEGVDSEVVVTWFVGV